MKQLLMASIVLIGFSASAQFGPIWNPSDGIVDGIFLPEHIPTKRMIPYEPVREADVVWSKRVWSAIDLRQKINHPLYYPLDEMQGGQWTRNSQRWSLWTIIRLHVLNGDLTVYSPYNPALMGLGGYDGDQLKYPVKPQPGLNFYTDSAFRSELAYYMAEIGPPGDVAWIDENPNSETFGEKLIIIDPVTGDSSYKYDDPDTTWIMSEQIVEYRLKEDWFFDKERSVMDRRIIAIAPVKYMTEIGPDGRKQITGKEELFWLYFPHCRYVFNNYFVYNPDNDAQWMSFDDLFWKRRFSSYIYKESNTYDRDIADYRYGLDAVRESEVIKNEIRDIEHDVWSF